MTKVRIVRAEEQEVMVAWREHKAALAEERKGRRCVILKDNSSQSNSAERKGRRSLVFTFLAKAKIVFQTGIWSLKSSSLQVCSGHLFP